MTPVAPGSPDRRFMLVVSIALPEPYSLDDVPDTAVGPVIDHLTDWLRPIWLPVGGTPDDVSSDGEAVDLGWFTYTSGEAQAMGFVALREAGQHGYTALGSEIREVGERA